MYNQLEKSCNGCDLNGIYFYTSLNISWVPQNLFSHIQSTLVDILSDFLGVDKILEFQSYKLNCGIEMST